MKKRCHLLIVAKGYLIAFLLFFVSTGAHAFQYKGLDLKISSTISETYDDNLTFSKTDKKEDLITALGLNMSAAYEGKKRSLNLEGSVTFRENVRYKDIKNSSEGFSLNFQNELSEYDSVFLNYNFSHSHMPLSFEEEFGDVRGRVESLKNNYGVSYKRNVSEHFTFKSKFAYTQGKFIEEDEVESWQHAWNLGLNYIHSASTNFNISYKFTRNSFNVSNHLGSLGVTHYIAERLFYNLAAGVNFLPSFGITSSDLNATLTNEVNENFMASISFVRGEQSVSNRRDVFRRWEIASNFTGQLSERLSSSVSCFYGQGKYVVQDASNKLFGVNGSINYAVNEYLTSEMRYSYSNFDSTDKTQGYFRNTLLTSISMLF